MIEGTSRTMRNSDEHVGGCGYMPGRRCRFMLITSYLFSNSDKWRAKCIIMECEGKGIRSKQNSMFFFNRLGALLHPRSGKFYLDPSNSLRVRAAAASYPG